MTDEMRRSRAALMDALYAAHVAARAGVEQAMRELDLTDSLADVLWQLPSGESLSRGTLAERLKCDPSNVTFLMDRLERKGLVERGIDAHDRRVRTVRLTDAGAAGRERLIEAAAQAPAFAGLSTAETSELTTLLRRCVVGAGDERGA